MVIETKNLSVFREIFCGVWKWLCYNSSMGPSYDNGLGSFGNASSNGAGGAIISSSNSGVGVGLPSEGKKRWPVFVAIFLGIAAVVALVLMVVVPRGSGGNTAIDTRASFNKYANYYLLGEKQVENVTQGELGFDETFFWQQLNSAQNKTELFGNLSELFGDFQKLYIAQNRQNEIVVSYLEQYLTILEYLGIYYNGGAMSRNTLVEVYVENGRDGADELAGVVVSKYEGIGEIYGIVYSDVLSEWAAGTIELIDEYNANNCIDEGKLNYECASGLENENITRLVDKISSSYIKLASVHDDALRDSYSGIFEMNGGLFMNEGAEVNDEE